MATAIPSNPFSTMASKPAICWTGSRVGGPAIWYSSIFGSISHTSAKPVKMGTTKIAPTVWMDRPNLTGFSQPGGSPSGIVTSSLLGAAVIGLAPRGERADNTPAPTPNWAALTNSSRLERFHFSVLFISLLLFSNFYDRFQPHTREFNCLNRSPPFHHAPAVNRKYHPAWRTPCAWRAVIRIRRNCGQTYCSGSQENLPHVDLADNEEHRRLLQTHL